MRDNTNRWENWNVSRKTFGTFLWNEKKTCVFFLHLREDGAESLKTSPPISCRVYNFSVPVNLALTFLEYIHVLADEQLVLTRQSLSLPLQEKFNRLKCYIYVHSLHDLYISHALQYYYGVLQHATSSWIVARAISHNPVPPLLIHCQKRKQHTIDGPDHATW